MSSKLDRLGDAVVAVSSSRIQWNDLMDLVIEEVQKKKRASNVGASLQLGSGRKVVELISHRVEKAHKFDLDTQTLSKWKNVLIVIAVAMVAFAMFGAWLLSPTTLIVGAIILTVSSPSLVVALVLWGITSSEATKTKAKYKEIVKSLATQHMISVKKFIISKVETFRSDSDECRQKITNLIKDQTTMVMAWKDMQDREVQPVRLFRTLMKKHRIKIQNQIQNPTFPVFPTRDLTRTTIEASVKRVRNQQKELREIDFNSKS